MLPSHRFASGAEEKIVRVFECTKNFLRNVSNLSKIDVTQEFGLKVMLGVNLAFHNFTISFKQNHFINC